MMKRVLALTICFSTAAWAENSSLNLQLPSAPQNFQSDKFRAGDLDCQNAVGGGVNLEFGVTGVINDVGGSYSVRDNYLNDQSRE